MHLDWSMTFAQRGTAASGAPSSPGGLSSGLSKAGRSLPNAAAYDVAEAGHGGIRDRVVGVLPLSAPADEAGRHQSGEVLRDVGRGQARLLGQLARALLTVLMECAQDSEAVGVTEEGEAPGGLLKQPEWNHCAADPSSSLRNCATAYTSPHTGHRFSACVTGVWGTSEDADC